MVRLKKGFIISSDTNYANSTNINFKKRRFYVISAHIMMSEFYGKNTTAFKSLLILLNVFNVQGMGRQLKNIKKTFKIKYLKNEFTI